MRSYCIMDGNRMGLFTVCFLDMISSFQTGLLLNTTAQSQSPYKDMDILWLSIRLVQCKMKSD